MRPVIFLVVGPPGSGKSYARCRWIADEFLPTRTGDLWSNLPIKVESMAEFCDRHHGHQCGDVRARIKSIPREVLEDWRNERGGPWDFFADRSDGSNPIDRAHIVFDECHVYLPKGTKSSAAWRKQWEGWLGTIRHRGATVEFVTQDESKVAGEIVAHCESNIVLSSGLDLRAPVIGIRFADLYQLIAKITGVYKRFSLISDYTRIGSTWERVSKRVNVLSDKYFALYNSHNETEHGDAGGEGEAPEYVRLSWPAFLRWFVHRNFGVLVVRASFGVAFAFLLYAVGSGLLVRTITASVSSMVRIPTAESDSSDASDGNVPPAVAPGASAGSATVASSPAEQPDPVPHVVRTISSRFVGLDSGELVSVGESVGDWRLAEVVPARGVAVFRADDGVVDRLRVGGTLWVVPPVAASDRSN